MKCIMCGSDLLRQINTSSLPMVFSDGKKAPFLPFMYECTVCNTITKDLSEEWHKSVNNNYRYQYKPSTNIDIIKQGAHLNRIIDVVDNIDFKAHTSLRILDYGMGNGDLSKYLLQNDMPVVVDGFDPYSHDVGSFLNQSQRFRFYSDESLLFSSATLYDYIVLLQSFEHICNPQVVLHKLCDKLKPTGTIFIQIPTPYLNPVDLTVYDHAFHFCPSSQYSDLGLKSLPFLLSTIQVSNGKELLIKLSNNPYSLTVLQQFNYIYAKPFEALTSFLSKCRELCESTEDVVIFGNTYSSKWLFYALNEKYRLLTSDDFSQNRSLKNSCVLMPFPSCQAHRIASALGLNNYRCM